MDLVRELVVWALTLHSRADQSGESPCVGASGGAVDSCGGIFGEEDHDRVSRDCCTRSANSVATS